MPQAGPAAFSDPEIPHPRLTDFAVQKSVLYTNPKIMFSLGLYPPNKQLFTYSGRVGSYLSGTTTYPLARRAEIGANLNAFKLAQNVQ